MMTAGTLFAARTLMPRRDLCGVVPRYGCAAMEHSRPVEWMDTYDYNDPIFV
jgi:hypothetical protein